MLRFRAARSTLRNDLPHLRCRAAPALCDQDAQARRRLPRIILSDFKSQNRDPEFEQQIAI